MQVGVASRVWGQAEFHDVASEAQQAGYTGIETVGNLVGNLRGARRVTEDTGLAVTAGCYPANWFAEIYHPIELDQVRRVAEFYAGLGARYIITSSLPVPERIATAVSYTHLTLPTKA